MKLILNMTDSDTSFFKTFGERITALRKTQGLTQASLGDLMGVDQTAVASYESGRRRIPLSRLGMLANALRVSLPELLEEEAPVGKPGPTPKLQRQIEQVAELPRAKQKFVSEMIETVLQIAD